MMRFGALIILVAALTACGGGGGGANVTPGAATQNQAISFSTANTLSGAVGATVTNTAQGGGGTGAITYLSSNLAIATVNPATGAATLLSVGATTITATKAASAGFNQASASYTLTVTPGAQTISFSQAGPVSVLVGGAINNTVSGGAGTGTGTVSYSTSSNTIVSVDASTGLATALNAGVATITATKLADTNYQQTAANYLVNVADSAPVTAWVGATDALVTLPATANGASFLRARNSNCVLANILTCVNGRNDPVTGAPATVITDTTATTNAGAFYWLKSGGTTSLPLTANVSRFSERIGHSAVYYNSRYWVIGGAFEQSSIAKADIWTSTDGKTWELDPVQAPFGARWLQQTVVFNNKIWIIGGADINNGIASSIWSFDGTTWKQEGANLPGGLFSSIFLRVAAFKGEMWAVIAGTAYASTDGNIWTPRSAVGAVGSTTRRAYASLTEFNGKLWYAGGATTLFPAPYTSQNSFGDIWSSSDGVMWSQVVPVGPVFTSRFQHAAFVLNSRLWIFGGRNANGGVVTRSDNAWSTADGVTWQQEALSNTVDQSFLSGIVQEQGRITLIGGILRGYSNKVLQTTDGNNWTELSATAQFSPRISMAPVSFLGDLWVIGGASLSDVANNEIWRSSDGVNWTRVTTTGTIFSPRSGHRTLVHNNRLWVIAGWDNVADVGGTEVRTNDVWSSADGVSWQPETANAQFSPREAHAAVKFKNKMYVIGGGTATLPVNDVWSSDDGKTWKSEPQTTPFPARGGHTVVDFNGAMWLIGGSTSGTTATQNDIWKSTDGQQWAPVSTNVPIFAARAYHSSLVLNGRIWVIAGASGLPYQTGPSPLSPNFADVWSSADGATWRQETATAPFGPRWLQGATVHNNEMWVIGGQDLVRQNDVWRSSDGINWRVGFSHTIRMR